MSAFDDEFDPIGASAGPTDPIADEWADWSGHPLDPITRGQFADIAWKCLIVLACLVLLGIMLAFIDTFNGGLS